MIVLASRHTHPVPPRVLADLDLDPDEAVGAVVKAYHLHVEAYLATTSPPENVEQWVASGLLGLPLLGTMTKFTVDWCHAWSILGQWSGHVTFPVPATRVWPRHGHFGRSWMHTKAGSRTFTSGHGLPLSKVLYPRSACCLEKFQ